MSSCRTTSRCSWSLAWAHSPSRFPDQHPIRHQTSQLHRPTLFTPLLAALRKTLTARKGFPIWDNSRGVNNDFHVVLVDKVRPGASQKHCDAKTGAL